MLISKNDFYNWAYNDLLMNNQRGHLAEYIVACALDITNNVRDEWTPYDLEYKNIKLEIKSAAYLQSWHRKPTAKTKESKIIFGIAPTCDYDSITEQRIRGKKQRRADVYVFCLLKHRDMQTVNPTDTEQWAFWVVSTELINQLCGMNKTISMGVLEKNFGTPVLFGDLKPLLDKHALLSNNAQKK